MVRANAYVALRFCPPDKVRGREVLQKKGLSDNDPKARHAAIWTLGFLRDKGSRELLEREGKKERNPMGRLLVETAIRLIDGAEMPAIYLREVRQFTGETIPREAGKMPEVGEGGGKG